MTPEIPLVLATLAGAMLLFVTGWVRMDVTALLVLATLALSGVVTPAEALSGFSSPAVATVAGMFVLSAALGRTGVARAMGRQILRVAGTGEARLLLVIMVTAATLSAFMNNVGVAAMLLPVVMDITRRTGHAPSRFLLPLALACLMGGLLTLVGTPPNILVSDILLQQGFAPFRLFDFTPPALAILGTGMAFILLVGRRLLPVRDPRDEVRRPAERDMAESYALQERLFRVRIPPRSLLDGRTLGESRLGSALGLHVLSIRRGREVQAAPGPGFRLRGRDRLVVQGRPDLLVEIQGRRHLELVEGEADPEGHLASPGVGLGEFRVPADSPLLGYTAVDADLLADRGVLALALRRGETLRRTGVGRLPLETGDRILLQGPPSTLEDLGTGGELELLRRPSPQEALRDFQLQERLFALRITPGSLLHGRTLEEARLGDAAALRVLGVRRGGKTILLPTGHTALESGDLLLVKTHPGTLEVLRAFRKLEIEAEEGDLLEELESDRVGLLEVVLSPRSKLVGFTPREIGFRDRWGLSVLAIWRGGRAYRTNLRDMPLEFGDSLLVFGPRRPLALLARDPEFLVLTEALQEPPRARLAPVAVGILVAVLLSVLLGWVTIAIAVVAGATLAILTRCLTPEEAYRAVEWPAVVLIGGMLPLGIAMDRTGAARLVADAVLGGAAELGPRAVLAALCLLTALGAQASPSVALVVVMAPIALTAATELSLSPHALLMGVALSAASLSSPVAHPANVLVMGPGGYRYADYVRVGVPLTLLVLVVVVALLPAFLPLVP